MSQAGKEDLMKGKGEHILVVTLILGAVLFSFGCSSDSNSDALLDPVSQQDISGVWLGYIGSTFSVGIITTDDGEEFSSLFIGQDKNENYNLFISDEDDLLVQNADSYIFTGGLDAFFWDTGVVEDYSTLAPLSMYVWTPGATHQVMGLGLPAGAYQYDESGETGIFAFVYNTTYNKVLPNVNNMSGQWRMENVFVGGNTLVLTIEPNAASTQETTISGEDSRSNTFHGTVVVHYSPVEATPRNVYDISLELNDSQLLTGLATYISETHTSGIDVSAKTLAIGAISADGLYMLGGLAIQE